jgi:WD repeat-containing protein 24
VRWRAGYECEVAVVSNDEFGESGSDLNDVGGGGGSMGPGKGRGDAVEIWGVKRGWIAKWAVGGSAGEGGVAGECCLSLLLISLLPIRFD